jgi:hypothetical protein
VETFPLLVSASASQAGGIFDAGTAQSSCSLTVTASGSPAFSVQLQGSADSVTWAAAGSPVTSAGTTALTPSPAARYFRAVLSGFTGPGAVTASVGLAAGTGFTGDPTLAQLDARYVRLQADPYAYLLPAGAIAQTLPRHLGWVAYTVNSGNLSLTAVNLPAGVTVGHITTASNTTAASAPLNWWYGLWDLNRVQLAVTADQLTTPFTANTAVTLAVASTAAGAATSFTTTYSGLHYVGFMMKATTLITLNRIQQAQNAITSIAPIPGGVSTTSLTAPPAFPATATAITSASTFYACVSP